ncbi:hypothetical protein BHE74_00002505 [Ensete ventricosum]|nr:hypothetical protein BHE74_00002505 [Ensete ventricosum]
MVPFDSRRSVYRSYRMVDSEGHLPSSVSGSGNSSTPRWRRLLRLCRGTTTPCDGSASCRSPSLWFPLHAYVHMRVRSRFETRTHFTTKRISFVRVRHRTLCRGRLRCFRYDINLGRIPITNTDTTIGRVPH